VAFEYLSRIEKMVITAIHQARALFAGLAPKVEGVYRWLTAATAGNVHPVVYLNRLSIAAGYGAVFCSLAPEAGRRRKNSGIRVSHDNASAAGRQALLYSG
jgi:hypothetical protein